MNNNSKMRRNYSEDVEDWNFQKVLSILEAELYSIYVSSFNRLYHRKFKTGNLIDYSI